MAPVVASRQIVSSFWPSNAVRKVRPAVTTGDEWPGGRSAFHKRFFSGPNCDGGFAPSGATPWPLGPRNRGQSAESPAVPRAAGAASNTATANRGRRGTVIRPPVCEGKSVGGKDMLRQGRVDSSDGRLQPPRAAVADAEPELAFRHRLFAPGQLRQQRDGGGVGHDEQPLPPARREEGLQPADGVLHRFFRKRAAAYRRIRAP